MFALCGRTRGARARSWIAAGHREQTAWLFVSATSQCALAATLGRVRGARCARRGGEFAGLRPEQHRPRRHRHRRIGPEGRSRAGHRPRRRRPGPEQHRCRRIRPPGRRWRCTARFASTSPHSRLSLRLFDDKGEPQADIAFYSTSSTAPTRQKAGVTFSVSNEEWARPRHAAVRAMPAPGELSTIREGAVSVSDA